MAKIPLHKTELDNLMLDYFQAQNIEVIDERHSKGDLWLIGGFELAMNLQSLNAFGLHFDFKRTGGKITGHRPGWKMLNRLMEDNQAERMKYFLQDELQKASGTQPIPVPQPTPKPQATLPAAPKDFCGFIDHISPEAAMNAHLLETLIYHDPASAQVKGRSFGEAIVKFLFVDAEENEKRFLNFHDKINYLLREGLIDKDIYQKLDSLRKAGNVGAHDGINTDVNVAINQHRTVYDIAKWFYEVYCTKDLTVPLYRHPAPPTVAPTSTLDEAKIAQLISSQITQTLVKQNPAPTPLPTPEPAVALKPPKAPKKDFSHSRECIVDELSKLKESSKEAVETLNEFSKFKDYMHIKGDVQQELSNRERLFFWPKC